MRVGDPTLGFAQARTVFIRPQTRPQQRRFVGFTFAKVYQRHAPLIVSQPVV